MGRLTSEYCPLPLETTLRVSLVPWSTTVTVTLGTAAPLASTTVPVMPPRVCCAFAGATAASSRGPAAHTAANALRVFKRTMAKNLPQQESSASHDARQKALANAAVLTLPSAMKALLSDEISAKRVNTSDTSRRWVPRQRDSVALGAVSRCSILTAFAHAPNSNQTRPARQPEDARRAPRPEPCHGLVCA